MNYLVYKKGLDNREIFVDKEDFELWEKLLAEYLQPYREETTIYKGLRPYRLKHKQAMNLHGKVELLAYCLMPSYLYMVVKEYEKGALTSLMRKISTFYSMYYNRKHHRRGYVFEGSFRSQIILDLENTIRLVHEIPAQKIVKRFGVVQTTSGVDATEYPYSSVRKYGVKDKGEGRLPW